jgi:hypothetical protein
MSSGGSHECVNCGMIIYNKHTHVVGKGKKGEVVYSCHRYTEYSDEEEFV